MGGLSLADDILESFDNHPPIMLPTGGFKVDLETDHLDDNVYRHLLYIRHFLWSLRSKSPHSSDSLEAEPPKVTPPLVLMDFKNSASAECQSYRSIVSFEFSWVGGYAKDNVGRW